MSDTRGSRGGARRGKRIIGVLMLAAVCVAMALWAMRARDGSGDTLGPSSASAATGGNPAPDTTPATTAMMNTSPLGTMALRTQSQPATEPAPQPVNPAPAPAPASNPLPDLPGTPIKPAGNQPIVDPTTQPASITPGPTSPAEPSIPIAANSYAMAVAAADRAQQQQRTLEARNILNRALLDPINSAADRANLRKKLADLNQSLVFGPNPIAGDPLCETYKVTSGDVLNKINRKLGLVTEPSLIARVNKLANPNALKIGQTLKVIRGPFHAVVSKSAYRMDIYAGPTPAPSSIGTMNFPEGAEPGWMYICSFPVGLGAQGLTPIGNFTVKEGSKLVNPHWVNPRTSEKFAADDPKNPIGERWMGLEGLDDKSKAVTGYGIHGTVDPASIGKEMSMGCIRVGAADIEIVYELLMGRVSVVKIVP
ncbi:MAG: L,D-transpeptidase family protein [Phycisphaerales bacterium]|nr:L,D-transpeptidase family protein [Phycisphaerales bacterium]